MSHHHLTPISSYVDMLSLIPECMLLFAACTLKIIRAYALAPHPVHNMSSFGAVLLPLYDGRKAAMETGKAYAPTLNVDIAEDSSTLSSHKVGRGNVVSTFYRPCFD